MAAATIELIEVTLEEKETFTEAFEEYLGELNAQQGTVSAATDVAGYQYWNEYWDGTPGRYVFWINIGGGNVGFLMVREVTVEEWGSEPKPLQISEYCILPPFRSREIGGSVLTFLLEDCHERGEPLTWDCHQANQRAVKFYDRVVEQFKTRAGSEWAMTKTEIETDGGPHFRYICQPA